MLVGSKDEYVCDVEGKEEGGKEGFTGGVCGAVKGRGGRMAVALAYLIRRRGVGCGG